MMSKNHNDGDESILIYNRNPLTKSPLILEEKQIVKINELVRENTDSNSNSKADVLPRDNRYQYHNNKGFSYFDLTPPEILHIILMFYTSSLKGLLKFSTINRSCQTISKCSLIWLTCDLVFHAPFAFFTCIDLSREEYLTCTELKIENQIYRKLLFTQERRFHMTCVVVFHRDELPAIALNNAFNFLDLYMNLPSMQPFASLTQEPNESSYQYAERISSYVLALNRQFQHYWIIQVKYRPFCKRIQTITNSIESYFPYYILLSNVIVSISMYLLHNLNYSDLSANNLIGFQCLFVIYILDYLLLINGTIKRCVDCVVNSWGTKLKLEFPIPPNGVMVGWCVIGLGFLIFMVLCYCKLIGLISISSWIIVCIFWVFLFPAWRFLMLFTSSRRINDTDATIMNIIGGYMAVILPISFLLLALYYDGHGNSSYLGYAVVPWYPFFLAFMLPMLTAPVKFCLENSFAWLIRRRNIGAPGKLFPRSGTPQWLLNIWIFVYLWVFAGCAVLASLGMVVLSVSSFTGEVWEVGGVRLTATFLVLLVINNLLLYACLFEYYNDFIIRN